jgi:hypothetical protein
VVLIGQRKALAMAVRNNNTAKRFSGLRARLKASAHQGLLAARFKARWGCRMSGWGCQPVTDFQVGELDPIPPFPGIST